MVRTRDFLLYVVVFAFILTGIVFTVSAEKRSENADRDTISVLQAQDGADVAAVTSATTIDRVANIAALRDKIAKGEGQIVQGEPVFTSVDTPTTTAVPNNDSVNLDTPLALTDREPRYCASRSQLNTSPMHWPSNGVTLNVVEGARIAVVYESKNVQVGSTTKASTSKKVLLQMPVSPVRGNMPSCLDSETVGISLDGTLIQNNETWRFRGMSSESVVGYARDGHPIYGQGVDERLLDSCGGYNNGSGYRYHLREKELFVLGCFVAPAATFIE